MGVAQGWAARGLRRRPRLRGLPRCRASPSRSGRPRPARRPVRSRIPGTHLGGPGPSRGRPHALRRGPSHRTWPRIGPLFVRPLAHASPADRPRPLAVCQKPIAVNPWLRIIAWRWPAPAPRRRLAGAVAACREAIRLNPELSEARSLLVQCYLRVHELDKADTEFQICSASTPPAAKSGSNGTRDRSGRCRGHRLRDESLFRKCHLSPEWGRDRKARGVSPEYR